MVNWKEEFKIGLLVWAVLQTILSFTGSAVLSAPGLGLERDRFCKAPYHYVRYIFSPTPQIICLLTKEI